MTDPPHKSPGANACGGGRAPEPVFRDGAENGGVLPLGLGAGRARVELELARAQARALADALRASDEELRRTRSELDSIRASHAWRAATLYHRTRDRFRSLLGRTPHDGPGPRPAGAAGVRAAEAPPPLARAYLGGLTGLTLGRRGRVSVLLPVIRETATLREAIDAVLAQSHGDVELVIVNGCSPGPTTALLEEYADHRRVMVVEDPSRTVASSLEVGLAVATGEFVSLTSPGHVPLTSQLEVMVRHLEEHPDEALVSSDYEIGGAGSSCRGAGIGPCTQASASRPIAFTDFERAPRLFAGASLLLRRDAAHLVGRFPRDATGAEHYDLWLRVRTLFATGHVPRVLHHLLPPSDGDGVGGEGVDEVLARLQRRDEERRAFLRKAPTWLWIGDAAGGRGAAAPGGHEHALLSFASSRAGDPALATALRPDVLAVCRVDQPVDALDDRLLAFADLLVVSDPTAQLHLEKRFAGRAFLIGLDGGGPMLERVARLRLFEKRRVPALPDAPIRVSAPREPLRVALQTDRLDRGGLEQVVLDLARHLDRARVRATILVHGSELGATGRLLREEGHDVVVTGGDEAHLLAAVEERRIQVVNLHHSRAGVARHAARGTATVYTIHSCYAWMTPEAIDAWSRSLQPVDQFVAVSSEVERFSEVALGLDPRRVRVIPNGLDARELEAAAPAPRAALGLEAEDVVFLQVGSVYPLKLQAVTLEAFRRIAPAVPRARLVLAGNAMDPEYSAEVERAARHAALAGRVRRVPWSSRSEVAGLLQSADCFVLPSLVEGRSLALMEAVFFGLPAIVTDVGSARELVEDGENGIVLANPFPRLADLRAADLAALAARYPDENTRALAAAMRRIADGPDEWRARARRAAEPLRKGLDVRATAAAYADAFADAWRRLRKH